MCGIAGFFSFNKSFSDSDLQRMTDRIAHRGPDADGFYTDIESGVGLGHRRLSILDLSTAANQPMRSHCGRYYIVFNGEVYNYREIAEKLGIKCRTTSDTEVILEAFILRGPDFVHLLNGMFALAIYDSRDKVMHLYRDRLGVKPLIYHWQGGDLAFASEIKALLTLDKIDRSKTTKKESVFTFLNAGYIPEPHTIYDNISKLPAGSYAVIKDNKMEITSYWKPEERITADKLSDFTTAKRQLKELLESSVRYRMISDVPFGVFLSGGIDSSTVAAISQSISGESIKTFSIGVKDEKMNEAGFARSVSEYLKTDHYEFIVSERDSLDLVDKMIMAYDEPYADSSAIPTMLVSKLARQHVTMALTGDGGDELFMGYGAYVWAERFEKNPLLKTFRSPIGSALGMLNSKYKRAAGLFHYADEKRLKSHIFSQEQYYFSERELHDILLDQYIWPLQLQEEFHSLTRRLSAKEEQALYDIKNYLKDDLLVKVDIASMQFSLEARPPFLDYRIVEFALNLDENLKLNNGVSKYLLKEVLYSYVPKHLFDRPKKGFSIPLAKWLHNDLKFLVDTYLSKESIESGGFVRYEKVKSLLDRFEKGDDYLFNRIWVLILLHKWSSQS
jgi:asparagine synthase (glutamine-hydrolysing)